MRLLPSLCLSPFAALTLAAAVHGQGGVHVVGPGLPFTAIQPAVDAALDGDLILVRGGSYTGFQIDGKSLIVAADAGASVTVTVHTSGQRLRVANLSGAQSVSLLGLDVRTGPLAPIGPYIVAVEDCAGPVLLEDCTIATPPPVGGTLSFGDGLRIDDSAAVTLVRSTIDVSTGSGLGGVGAAIRTTDSQVFVHDCELFGMRGTEGESTFETPGGIGAAGVDQVGGRVVLVSSTVTGGEGGPGVPPGGFGCCCTDAGPGGPGVRLVAGAVAPELVLVDTQFVGGVGGTAPSPCVDGSDGPQTDVLAGGTTSPAVAPRLLDAQAVVGDGETLTATFRGEPLDFLLVAYGFAPNLPVWVPDVTGALYPAFPPFTLGGGQLDAAGETVLTFHNQDTGFRWLPLWVQGFHFGVELVAVAGCPRLVVLLDE